jgi:hypothetical protein
VVDEVAQSRAHPARETYEVGKVRVRFPPAERGEPARVRKVVERDHRRDAARATRERDGAIVRERCIVIAPGQRFEAAPLDREAIRVEADRPKEIEIFLEALPMEARAARASAPADRAGTFFPLRPIVPVVAAFDLVRGGRGAPEERKRWSSRVRVVRCVDWRHHHGRNDLSLGVDRQERNCVVPKNQRGRGKIATERLTVMTREPIVLCTPR